MNDIEQRSAAKDFATRWKGRGYEKGETQVFWIELLRRVLGVADAEQRIIFEDQVKLGNTGFIDARIPESRVLIEQKGLHINLDTKARQSDGSLLTPLEQARRYVIGLPVSQHPRYIVVCNFSTFQIYDCEKQEVETIALEELPREYHRLSFLIDATKELRRREMEVSLQAGELVGKLYDALLHQYHEPESPETLHSLNALCVRLVFCLYAEDAGIFGGKDMFHDYLKAHYPDARRALIDLFRVLDTQPGQRDPYMDADLAAFPYVNGGLFAEDGTVIPRLTEEILELILQRASADFDWSMISPTIFGAVFESTLNPQTRRSGGMHYTSIENIHKVIDPLFLEALRDELEDIRSTAVARTRMLRLKAFQEKLSRLTFFDPACGSGNFLTETYLSLRRLENVVISLLNGGQGVFLLEDANPIRVSIGQFYGIEINDFAATVARTALWIAESQMLRETEAIVRANLDFLPLKSYVNIVEGNALRMDWESVVPRGELGYIMGNPPFVGYKLQSDEQKEDLRPLLGNTKNVDYVVAWFFKAAQMIQGTGIAAAFVATNSITQGEQVAAAWKLLHEKFRIRLLFAHRTFCWDSEASIKAHVHCVIIGFDALPASSPVTRRIYTDGVASVAQHINAYLMDAPEVFIDKRSTPLCDCEKMVYGSEPREGGYLLLDEAERRELLAETPDMAPFIKRFVSSTDFINNNLRYCLWLVEAPPALLRKSPIVMERLAQCRAFREGCRQKQAHEAAATPSLFASPRQPDTPYLLIPIVSSANRPYIPIGYMEKDIILSNACFSVRNAAAYTFGIITSAVHMAWVRAVCGRLKSDYRYSNTVVYNNFPWPSPTNAQRESIEKTAQGILEARALHPDSSLADLYDDVTMPPELRRAHQKNDKAVMQAYGFAADMDESAMVAELMKMYRALTE